MSAYELIKYYEEGCAVKDCTSAKPVDQWSPFRCHLGASSYIENYIYFRSVFAIWKMELAGSLYLSFEFVMVTGDSSWVGTSSLVWPDLITTDMWLM